MMKKVFNYLLLLFLCFNFSNIVNAKVDVQDNGYMMQELANISGPKFVSITANNDLVTVKTSGSVVGYYWGESPTLSQAKFTSTNSNTYYAAVKNGIYYVWVAGSGVSTGNVNAVMYSYGIKVTSSCTNQRVENCSGSGTIERCYIYTGGKSVTPEKTGTLVTPANGYKLDSLKVDSNNCSNLSLTVGGQRLAQRYCRVVFAYMCSKNTGGGSTTPKNDCVTNPNAAGCKNTCTGCACTNSCKTIPYLTGLTVSPGTLSPAFDTKNTAYNVVVDASVSQINIQAVGSRGNASGTITGTGVKNLSYGTQTFKISIANNAKTIDYYVTVTRQDPSYTDNTLSAINLSVEGLNPEFNPAVTTYNLDVENNVDSITIDAVLNNENASFVEGFGPRTVELKEGTNPVQIRVLNKNGETNIYTINVNRLGMDACTRESATKARLKVLALKTDKKDIKLPKIDFKPDQLTYSGIQIPYEARNNLYIDTATEIDGDTVKVNDFELVKNVETEIKITVTSRECPNVTKEYIILATLMDKQILDNNALLSGLSVKNHSELKYAKNVNNYAITLAKNESKVKLNYTTETSTAICTDNNKDDKGNLVSYNGGEVITITCIAQDGVTKEVYTIKVNKQKKTNIIVVLLIVILIVLLLIYLVLRLLGYKIYFNFEMIGSFFRGIGDSIRRTFDR